MMDNEWWWWWWRWQRSRSMMMMMLMMMMVMINDDGDDGWWMMMMMIMIMIMVVMMMMDDGWWMMNDEWWWWWWWWWCWWWWWWIRWWCWWWWWWFMALDGDEDHDDQARSKAMRLTVFQSEGLTPGNEGIWIHVHMHEGTHSATVNMRLALQTPTTLKLHCLPLDTSSASICMRLEALAVNDGRARLIIFALGDPHLLESAQRRQNRTILV